MNNRFNIKQHAISIFLLSVLTHLSAHFELTHKRAKHMNTDIFKSEFELLVPQSVPL